MKPFLYQTPILPEGFVWPQAYLALVQSGAWPDLAPWQFLARDMARTLSTYGALLLKFPGRPLVPFAEIDDPSGFYNDGYPVVACFDGREPAVVRIFDYGRPKQTPWDNLSYPDFDAWMAAAREESLRYKADLSEHADD
ncbi:hypothetical protein CEG14_09435 [Bordetella genomosp. 1]|uniref:Knr4/Smi1-like domain-containing protein n=1 Tax=Bordetella genomosp. 1 TaxID=1395607 RepID=A0A261SD35_9BORD|nr:hypothetical protein [Bordetella genomosp. 1]OZI35314.1 hypothetical protein CEG14_09435 [Bordetella genomosp. 1]OZI63854.1 hypothetical protein CAL27_14745 [Bordetella genomosp. 1]